MADGGKHSICINIESTVQVIFHSQLLMVAMGGREKRTEFSGSSIDGPVGQLDGHQEETLVLLSQHLGSSDKLLYLLVSKPSCGNQSNHTQLPVSWEPR